MCKNWEEENNDSLCEYISSKCPQMLCLYTDLVQKIGSSFQPPPVAFGLAFWLFMSNKLLCLNICLPNKLSKCVQFFSMKKKIGLATLSYFITYVTFLWKTWINFNYLVVKSNLPLTTVWLECKCWCLVNVIFG